MKPSSRRDWIEAQRLPEQPGEPGVQVVDRVLRSQSSAAEPVPRAASFSGCAAPNELPGERRSNAVAPVLILWAEQFSAEWIRERVVDVHPQARCLVSTTIASAEAILALENVGLLVTAVNIPDGDTLNLLWRCHEARCCAARTLVVTGQPAARLVVSLHALGVAGVFDMMSEVPDRIGSVLRTIAGGETWWSESASVRLVDKDGKLVRHQLTAREQFALAVVGDGCGNRVAAGRLGMKYNAVRKLRRALYEKLGVRCRDGLVHEALRLGYTRLTRDGIVPLGLGVLLNEHRLRTRPGHPVG